MLNSWEVLKNDGCSLVLSLTSEQINEDVLYGLLIVCMGVDPRKDFKRFACSSVQ